MKKFFVCIFLCFVVFFQAQLTSYTLVKAGYKNQNGNYASVGAELYLVSPKHHIWSFAANANVGNMNQKFLVIPELEVQYMFTGTDGKPHSENFHSAFYTIGIRGNQYYVEPKIGIVFLSLVEANIGYSLGLKEHDFTSFQGITFGLQFHIPTQIFGN